MNRTRMTVMILALATAAGRAALAWHQQPSSDWRGWHFASLVVLAAALGHAVLALAGQVGSLPSSRSRPPRWIWLLWFSLVVIAIALWPFAFDPDRWAWPALLMWGVMVAFPVAIVDASYGSATPPVRAVELWRRLLLIACGLFAAVSLVSYVRAMASSVGGVDFYYYVCIARDMLVRPGDVSDNNYIYFPGVYAFWRTVMHWVGTSLPALQWAYLIAWLTNAVLVACVVWRPTRSLGLAVFAGLWYCVLSTRFDSLSGVSEPLATVWALAGVLMWGGQPLRGPRGWWTALALGIGWGLSVYMKQQAGLLTLGAAALLMGRWTTDRATRHAWAQLVAIPLIAFATLSWGLLAEGHGWVPWQRGLQWATGYGREGSLVLNLYTQIRGDESAALAAGLSVLAWCGLWRRPPRGERMTRPAMQVASLALLAFLCSLVQFASRPFGHYMLLGVPFLVIACLLLAHECWSLVPRRYNQSQLVLFLILGLPGALFVNTAGRHDTLYVWRPVMPRGVQLPLRWHERPLVERDLERLRREIPAGSRIYVVAPRRCVVYYQLQASTASRYGYQFAMRDLDSIDWQSCDFVLIPTSELEPDDLSHCTPAQRDAIRTHILSLGFERSLTDELRTMELYRRLRVSTR